jgi:hypothetical protein
MPSDPDLLRKIASFNSERFAGEVFRVTPLTTNPLAPSVSGGRWAPPALPGREVPILYASLERDGALAEVASYLARLTPIPGPRNLKVTRLSITAGKALRLTLNDLQSLGVDLARYGERDYATTQEIGVAVAGLGIEVLIAPSARWRCENAMLFPANLADGADAAVIDVQEIEWRAWAASRNLLP